MNFEEGLKERTITFSRSTECSKQQLWSSSSCYKKYLPQPTELQLQHARSFRTECRYLHTVGLCTSQGFGTDHPGTGDTNLQHLPVEDQGVPLIFISYMAKCPQAPALLRPESKLCREWLDRQSLRHLSPLSRALHSHSGLLQTLDLGTSTDPASSKTHHSPVTLLPLSSLLRNI